MTKMIAFDMDGTILNSMPVLEDLAVNVIVEHLKITPTLAHRSYRYTMGKPFREQLEKMNPDGEMNTYIANEYEKRHADIAPLFPLAPGVNKKWIMSLGIPAVLVSSTHRSLIQERIKTVHHIGLRHIGGYSMGHDKKDQLTGYLMAFDVRPSDALFVGDTESDRQCAASLGMEYMNVSVENIVWLVNLRLGLEISYGK